jgi:beta-lactamase regulating signal transducer with metallopeptidase domain
MGVLWFSTFILLGLLVRKLKHPIIFSAAPLLLLLVLSVLRMFIVVELPSKVIVWSESFYPAIVNFFRMEFLPYRPLGFSINITNVFICVWIVVTVSLTARYVYKYLGRFPGLMRNYETMIPDEHAESLLSKIIGSGKYFRVYRSGVYKTPLATAFKPYIILPKVEFSDDELRVILLHEWKHIQDKDYLTDIIINLTCFIFWWNPVVYILKKNFKFAKELKCDGYAIPNKQDFHHLLDGLVKLDNAEKEKARSLDGSNALVSKEDELVDRLTVMAMRWESRSNRRLLISTAYSIVIVALFFASYAFTVLPIAKDSSYRPLTDEDFIEEYSEPYEVFSMVQTEIFLVDNGNDTFSYYVDGNFVMNVDSDNDILNWVEIRTRESD